MGKKKDVVEKNVDPHLLTLGVVGFVAIIGIVIMLSASGVNIGHSSFRSDDGNFVGVALRNLPAPVGPGVSFVSPQNDQEFTVGSTISFEMSAWGDNSVASVKVIKKGFRGEPDMFICNAGPVVISQDGLSFWGCSWSGASLGTHSLVAVATDSDGLTALSDTISISVVRRGIRDKPIN